MVLAREAGRTWEEAAESDSRDGHDAGAAEDAVGDVAGEEEEAVAEHRGSGAYAVDGGSHQRRDVAGRSSWFRRFFAKLDRGFSSRSVGGGARAAAEESYRRPRLR